MSRRSSFRKANLRFARCLRVIVCWCVVRLLFGLAMLAPSLRGRPVNSCLIRAEVLYDHRHPINLLPCSNAAALPLAALLVVLDAGCAPVKWELCAGAASGACLIPVDRPV